MNESGDTDNKELLNSSQSSVTEQAVDSLDELGPSLKGSPQDLSVLVRTVVRESHSGLLPPADQFERYEQVSPGADKGILGMAKEEQPIRKMIIGLERRRIHAATLVSFGMISLVGIGMFLGIS